MDWGFIFFPISLKKFEEMIEPFRLHKSRDSEQAQARQKEQPWKITDEELRTFEEKVEWSKTMSLFPFVTFGVADLSRCSTD